MQGLMSLWCKTLSIL